MSHSEAFKKVAAEKNAANAAEASRIVTANTRLEHLYTELRKMEWDLKKNATRFEWGHSKFRDDEKCIVLRKTRGDGEGSNAISCHSGLFRAHGGPGMNKWNPETHEYEDTFESANLGESAKEAAEAIARSLVTSNRLPALGHCETVGWYVSEPEERGKIYGILFFVAIALFVLVAIFGR